MLGGYRRTARLLAAATAVGGATALGGLLPALGAAAAGAPKAEISINPAGGILSVAFTARWTGFTSAVTSYDWSFGDGTKATTTTRGITHRYANAGRFDISVTEVDSQGQMATADGTVELFQCAVNSATCTENLGGVGQVQSLEASGPVSPAAPGAMNLFVGPFKILDCEPQVGPAAALTDSGFTGNLTVTLKYTTSFPSQVGTTCYASTVPFLDASGKSVTSGAIPACQSSAKSPCVESISLSGKSVTKVLLVPPGDPKVGSP